MGLLEWIFGKPVYYKVIKLNKNSRYLFQIDTDNFEIIKAFRQKLEEAHKSGENIYIPTSVIVRKMKKGANKWK